MTKNNAMKFICGLVYVAVVFVSAAHSIKLRKYNYYNIDDELGFDNLYHPYTETVCKYLCLNIILLGSYNLIKS